MGKSTALTLSYRHKKKSTWWAFKKYGKDLTIVYTNKKGKELTVKLEIPSASKVKWNLGSNYGVNTYDVMPVVQEVPIPKFLNIIVSTCELHCSIPNCLNEVVHWHHVKHQKKIKEPDRLKHIKSLIAK